MTKARTMHTTSGRLASLLAVMVGGLLAACDTEVINPGRVQEQFLYEQDAHEAIVKGIGRALAEAQNWVGYTGAAITREIHPSGSTGSFGIQVEWQNGELDYETVNTHWDLSQRARWWGNDGIAKMLETGPESQELLTEAYLWAGYAHRLMGENFCQSVIDGGPAGSRDVYLQGALDHFDQAASSGSGDMAMAARAARASVKAFMGDWAGAAADAAGVPDDFEWVLPYHSDKGDPTKNRIQFASQAEPYKAHTMRYTKYQGDSIHYQNDTRPLEFPRVPFRITDETGDAAVNCCGQVPWWPQTKYEGPGADIPMSKGAEMRLIEAEAMLTNGDWEGALAKINAVRTAAGVPTVDDADDVTSVGKALMHERGIVLWLEGRRLGDRWRWKSPQTDSLLHPLERYLDPPPSEEEDSHLTQEPDLCFPIARSEVDTNDNIGGGGG